MADLQTIIEARQRLDSQLQENQAVQKEFASLEDDATIYKLIGPILVKQDNVEAKSNVDKRLEYIQNEMWVRKELVERWRWTHIWKTKLS